ncbi:PREDICTED: 26S proteasome non-ATPase regulatory subunit 8-like [Rhagoletis zephyria]|uniref:26S proteasome non-ATPase regulatory subunit 8-like n=1 Tax=Rhagoletis zephyria TaxID=28612 RepID=UPI0008117887|nr:PREDICTED: 26S proteasome non-ATPase regulatory subunit 8-like [Rhagoletis zephyria]XP_036319092.1 26S proteasome non-ATPase regulatory subunit 8 [Rhagoletis pomonella]
MASLTGIENLYKELKSEWSKKPQNLKKCGQLVDNLKIELTKLAFLPTGDIKTSKNEMVLARDVLEIAVEYSVANKDIPAYERYMSQLKCYYYDYKQQIGESENMYKLLGINLLYLLSVNRVSEFHTELELLSADTIQNNKYIRPILALEQYIMEGRYNKIFQAKSSAPSEIYNHFMDILLNTVRDEIGACIEKSYEKISAKEAAKRLNLNSIEEVKAFGQKRNWNLGSDGVYNFVEKVAKPKEALPSVELAEQAIFYARELEMIV